MKCSYVCHYCRIPTPPSEPVKFADGGFFHTHRDCYRNWLELQQVRKYEEEADDNAVRGID
jgi:hypothetical protein